MCVPPASNVLWCVCPPPPRLAGNDESLPKKQMEVLSDILKSAFFNSVKDVSECTCVYTVEPPNKGQFGANSFVPCRVVVPISEVLAWCCNKCPL